MMNTDYQKILQVKLSLMGMIPKDMELPLKRCLSVKDFLSKHYLKIFPSEEPHEADKLFAWQSFTRDNVKLFIQYFNYHITLEGTNNTKVIHLIDTLCPGKLTINSPGMYHNDSAWFFVIENLEEAFNQILKKQEIDVTKELLGVTEHVLSSPDAQIQLDNFTTYKAESQTGLFMRNLIPSTTWLLINNPELKYYRQFLISLANNLTLMDYCLDRSTPLLMKQSNKEEWLHNLLYRIHSQMLTLLSIQEAFVRVTYGPKPVLESVYTKCGINQLQIDANEYYKSAIVSHSISEVYQQIFMELEIKDYLEYILYCADSQLSSQGIAKIVHTFRIIYNKLKHAVHIKVIRSRDAEALRQAELSGIESEIQNLESDNTICQLERDKRLFELSIRKEFIEKVRHMHENIDFNSNHFIEENGIRVYSSPDDYFTINIADIELAFKVLIGILSILQRSLPVES